MKMEFKMSLQDQFKTSAWVAASNLRYLYYSQKAARQYGCNVASVPDGNGGRKNVVYTNNSPNCPDTTIYNWPDTQVVWCGKSADRLYVGKYASTGKYNNHPPEVRVSGYTRGGKAVRKHMRHGAHVRGA